MYAIIEDSGTQIKVVSGDKVTIARRKTAVAPNDEITFDKVLMLGNGEGNAKVGMPYLAGAKVKAKVLNVGLGEKIHIHKFRRRKGYDKKTGHRQPNLTVEITAING